MESWKGCAELKNRWKGFFNREYCRISEVHYIFLPALSMTFKTRVAPAPLMNAFTECLNSKPNTFPQTPENCLTPFGVVSTDNRHVSMMHMHIHPHGFQETYLSVEKPSFVLQKRHFEQMTLIQDTFREGEEIASSSNSLHTTRDTPGSALTRKLFISPFLGDCDSFAAQFIEAKMFRELPWRNPCWWCSETRDWDWRHRDSALLLTPLCLPVLSNLLSPPPSIERAGRREPKAASFHRKRFLLHEAGR